MFLATELFNLSANDFEAKKSVYVLFYRPNQAEANRSISKAKPLSIPRFTWYKLTFRVTRNNITQSKTNT